MHGDEYKAFRLNQQKRFIHAACTDDVARSTPLVRALSRMEGFNFDTWRHGELHFERWRARRVGASDRFECAELRKWLCI